MLGIVRGHRGALKVDSELGKGTTMRVLFPCTDQSLEVIAKNEPEAFDWQGSGTILVVDDEETVRAVAKTMLETKGFSVLTANDGREALEIAQQHDDIVAVLLDMTMPHLGGEDTFRELRQLSPDLKVVMMSGYNERDVTSRFPEKRLAGFIQKPFKQKALLGKLREVLGDS